MRGQGEVLASPVNDRPVSVCSGRDRKHLIPVYLLVKSQVLRSHLPRICFLLHFEMILGCSQQSQKKASGTPRRAAAGKLGIPSRDRPSLELLTVPFVIRPLEDSRLAYSFADKQSTKDRPSSLSGDTVT